MAGEKLIFVVEGSGVSSQKNFPLTKQIERICQPGWRIYSYSPFRFNQTCKFIDTICSSIAVADSIALFAKSAGAFKVFKYYHIIKLSLSIGPRLAIVTVDPYYPFWQCGHRKPINHDDTKPKNVHLWNLYQTNRYPKGAKVFCKPPWIWENINAGGTHSTIISRPVSIAVYKTALIWAARGRYA